MEKSDAEEGLDMFDKWYLAYGRDMNPEYMLQYGPGAKAMGVVWIPGARLIFRGTETLEPRPGSKTPGFLWQISAKDEKTLDKQAGVPDLYKKGYFPLTFDDKKIKAILNVTLDSQPYGLPSEEHLQTIAAAYKLFGIDPAILEEAVEVTRMLANSKK